MAPVSMILLGLTLEGFTTLSTGLAPSLALAICLRGVGGVGNGIENVAADTLLQKQRTTVDARTGVRRLL